METRETAAPAQVPSAGRIIHIGYAPNCRAAIVTCVHDYLPGIVHAYVLPSVDDPTPLPPQSLDEYQWHWPERT